MDFLYQLCIAPLEALMGAVLDGAFALTGSWGQSLVLLSLAVNILLLPLYHLAESWQEAERAIQLRMAAKKEEIRAVYRGREADMLLRALYRLHGYSPFMALRAGAGLLIQVPFFLAAYHLLNTSPVFAGQSFCGIADLSLPDGLLSCAGMTFNLLPLLMTGVNLISSAIYAARLSRGERLRLYALAAVFLLLLYASSAALLVYWTCNNIFSAGKNLAYGRLLPFAPEKKSACPAFVPPRPPRFLDCAFGLAGLGLFALVPAWARDAAGPGTVQLLLAGAAAALAAAFILRCLYLRHRPDRMESALPLFLALLGGAVLLCLWQVAPLKRIATFDGWFFYRCRAVIVALAAAWICGREPLCLLFARLGLFCERTIPERAVPGFYLSGLGLAAILVFWHTPADLYASDPEVFPQTLSSLLAGTTLRACVFLGGAACVLRLAPARLRPFLAGAALWIGLAAFAFVFPAAGNYGLMDGFILQEPALLSSRLGPLADAAVALSALALLRLCLLRNKGPVLAGLLQGAGLALLCLGAYALREAPPVEERTRGEGALPAYTDSLLGFSRHGLNTVVLMFDMFTGGHLERILAEEPELARRLDGFVWFPDTVSAGPATLLSLPSLLGGEEYVPAAVNKRRPASLLEDMHRAFAVLPEIFIARGAAVSLADVDELRPSLFRRASPLAGRAEVVGKSFVNDFVPYWRREMGLASLRPENLAPFLVAVGVFRAAPWTIRRHIYNNGAWMNTTSTEYNPTEGPLALVRLLPEISNAEGRGDTFKYIASQLTHFPWQIDPATCLPGPERTLTRLPDGAIAEHLAAERCALRGVAAWADWMKEAGVYDNTQWIVVSDHDAGDNTLGPEFDDLRRLPFTWRPHALLLLKSRQSRGPLRRDEAPMSTADVPALICRENGPCPGIPETDPGPGRVRAHSIGSGGLRRHGEDRFNIITFRVNGSMFRRDNWRREEP
jgi:YidC/Oxa1 family membrane protein insertase